MKNMRLSNFDWSAWRYWVYINAAAVLIASVIAAASMGAFIGIGTAIRSHEPENLLAFPYQGVITGIIFAVLIGGPAFELAMVGGAFFGQTWGPALWGGITLTVAGAVIGTFQWLALRRYFRLSPMWIVTSTLGWTIGGAVASAIAWSGDISAVTGKGNLKLLSLLLAPGILGFVAGTISGGLNGLMQSLILRKYAHRTHEWFFTNLIGWSIGGTIVGFVITGVGFVLGGAVSGAITAITLTRLLHYQKEKDIQAFAPTP